MILAAGKATRLGALGVGQPKCMLRLGQRPLLEWTIERLSAIGVAELVINVHHAPDVIRGHFGDGSDWQVHIDYLYEPEPLGTAGGVRNAQHLLADNEPFMVIYGDTVADWDLSLAVQEHRTREPLATIAVVQQPDPANFGVVRFGPDSRIQEFVEKPSDWRHLGQWVNAGLYILSPEIFGCLPAQTPCDFGKDVFPALLAEGRRLSAYARPGALLPIDTPDQYHSAQQAWIAEPLQVPSRRLGVNMDVA